MRRFYRVDVQPDLFGQWSLFREWGRIGQAGQVRAEAFRTWVEAESELDQILRAKERRGYC